LYLDVFVYTDYFYTYIHTHKYIHVYIYDEYVLSQHLDMMMTVIFTEYVTLISVTKPILYTDRTRRHKSCYKAYTPYKQDKET
jgi:hypothetical protein